MSTLASANLTRPDAAAHEPERTAIAAAAAAPAPAEEDQAIDAALLPQPRTWPLTLASACLFLLLDLPLGAALARLPWALARGGAAAAAAAAGNPLASLRLHAPLAGLLVVGTLLGLVAQLALEQRRWPTAQALAPALVGVATLCGAVMSLLWEPSATPGTGTDAAGAFGDLLFGLFAGAASALLPSLLSAGLGLAAVTLTLLWLLIAGASAVTLGDTASAAAAAPVPTGWETTLEPLLRPLLALLSVALLVVAWLRAQVRDWRRRRLAVIGPAVTLSLRGGALLCALVTLATLTPLALPRLPGLAQLWQQHVPPPPGVLHTDAPGGTAVLRPGTLLVADAAAVDGAQVVLRYHLALGVAAGQSLPPPPPLLVATLDRFDGTAWSAAPAAGIGHDTALPVDGGDVTLLRASITLAASLPGGYLPAFDQPLSFSVETHTRLLAAGDPTALTVADWQAASVTSGGVGLGASGQDPTRYDATSLLPAAGAAVDTPAHTGQLPRAVVVALTDVPAGVRDPLGRLLARGWTAGHDPLLQPVAACAAIGDHLRVAFALDLPAGGAAGTRPSTPAAGRTDSAGSPASVASTGLFAPVAHGSAVARDPVGTLLRDGHGGAFALVTAQALLCRLAGIPTRLAEGFQPGALNTGPTPSGRTATARGAAGPAESVVHARDFTLLTQVATAFGWRSLGLFDTHVPTIARGNATPSNDGQHAGATPTPTPLRTPVATAVAGGNPLGPHAPTMSALRRGVAATMRWAGAALALLLVLLLPALLLGGVASRRRLAAARRRGDTVRVVELLLRRLVRPARWAGVRFAPGDTTREGIERIASATRCPRLWRGATPHARARPTRGAPAGAPGGAPAGAAWEAAPAGGSSLLPTALAGPLRLLAAWYTLRRAAAAGSTGRTAAVGEPPASGLTAARVAARWLWRRAVSRALIGE
jgi:hypothetical protein